MNLPPKLPSREDFRRVDFSLSSVYERPLSFLSDNFTQIIAFIGLSIFILLVLSSMIQLFHNNPASTSGVDLREIGDQQTTLEDESLGMTYGTRDKYVRNQIHGINFFLPISWSLILPSFGYVLILGIMYKGVQKSMENWNCSKDLPKESLAILQISSIIIVVVIYHSVFSSVIYQYFVPIFYISEGTEKIPFTIDLLYSGEVNQYRRLLILQGILIGSVAGIWTRKLLPEIQTTQEKQAYKLHMENWRQYGSWISTILGGVILSTSFIFIIDITPFGGPFIRHILVLFGGGLILIMSFVIVKLSKLESKIINYDIEDSPASPINDEDES